MMPRVIRRYSYLSVGLIAFGLLLLQYGNILPAVYGGYPMLLLPLVLFSGFHFGIVPGAVIGAVIGAAADIFAGSSPTFNAVVFCLFGCVSGFLMTYFFNRNRRSVSLITVIFCVLYFFVKWIVFYFTNNSPVEYFVKIGLPSALYTVVLCIPLYLLISLIISSTERIERR